MVYGRPASTTDMAGRWAKSASLTTAILGHVAWQAANTLYLRAARCSLLVGWKRAIHKKKHRLQHKSFVRMSFVHIMHADLHSIVQSPVLRLKANKKCMQAHGLHACQYIHTYIAYTCIRTSRTHAYLLKCLGLHLHFVYSFIFIFMLSTYQKWGAPLGVPEGSGSLSVPGARKG